MVAYSFKQRFVEPILAGTKRQTIRAHRKRHARPGEMISLYAGMRTKRCRLIASVTCWCVRNVSLRITNGERAEGVFSPGFTIADFGYETLDAFAVGDGFKDWEDMKAFWRETHGEMRQFDGVLILWEPYKAGGAT